MSASKYGPKTTAEEAIQGYSLAGYDAIVTGGSSGIGAETARVFAKAGARVVITARDMAKANDVLESIKKSTGNNQVEVMKLEIDSLKSVDEFVRKYLALNRPLSILVNNAGIMACPKALTKDGFESQFGTNHIGHHALTVGLLPALKA